MANPKGNDLEASVPKFCLLLEEDRRTPEGRVQSPKQFREHYFTYSGSSPADRIFKHMPREVRGPILTAWGIRGPKSALRDDDEKVQEVAREALTAGDIDDDTFEEGLAPKVVIRWVDLKDWWSFWRKGRLNKQSLRVALEGAYQLGLFDATWFLDTIQTPNGRLQGTDVLGDVLTKAELVEWVRNVHQSRDGTPRGLMAALGWERIIAKTADEVLLALLDAMAVKRGLAAKEAAGTPSQRPSVEVSEAASSDSVQVMSAADAEPGAQVVDLDLDQMTELPDDEDGDFEMEGTGESEGEGEEQEEETGVLHVKSARRGDKS